MPPLQPLPQRVDVPPEAREHLRAALRDALAEGRGSWGGLDPDPLLAPELAPVARDLLARLEDEADPALESVEDGVALMAAVVRSLRLDASRPGTPEGVARAVAALEREVSGALRGRKRRRRR